MSRIDQYAVSLSIDGFQLGIFDHLEGGDLISEENMYRPGGMAPQVSLGGIRSVTDIKVNRLYKLNRDHPLVPWLQSRIGTGKVTVVKQPLDVDANVFGRPLVYNGTLRNMNLPNADSKAGDPALLELDITPAGTIG